MTQRNFYQVLGVRGDASQADIRAAFVRLTKLHHPDSTGRTGDLPQRLQDVQAAYRCLSVAETRARHDAALAEVERAHAARTRAVQRRLGRYDRRHPRAQPRLSRSLLGRSLLRRRAIVLIALSVAVLVSLRLAA